MDHSWGYGTSQRLRSENQDCHGVFEFPNFTLLIVCDGMGGHVGGAQASSLAVRSIYESLMGMEIDSVPKALEEALQATNQAIYEAARKNHRLMGMGTTVVAAAVTDDQAWFAHVGDSRAYLVRDGSVQQLTRDHTMVNLFVDAELLTPEDAATHPEAHVLSRSLGVERQVDVEVSDSVPMQSDDVIFLCSDGVHGVVTDWEIANVDWGAPNEGVQHVIDIVAAREGDDNATCVALSLATSFEDVPATPVPEVKRFDDATPMPTSQSTGTVPLDDPNMGATLIPEPLHAPASSPLPAPDKYGQDTPSYVVYDEPTEATEEQKAPVGATGEGDNDKQKKQDAPSPVKRALLILAGIAAVALVGVIGVGGMGAFYANSVINGDDVDGDGASDSPPVVAVADAADPTTVEPEVPEPVEEPPPEEPEEQLVFAPEIPTPPRRLPHRPMRFTQPPPGGPLQWEAVQAARNHECRDAIEAVAEGMRMSVDHATLYSQAWFCFNETHQRPLAERTIRDWQDFVFLIPHLEGPPETREQHLDEKTLEFPEWYQPAVNGIEFRMEYWSNSDNKDKMGMVLSDLLGEPTLADHLAKDLLLEAFAAEGLSRVENPDARVVNWWARRVYVVSSALNGRIGRMLEAHRPELVPQLRAMLERSIKAPELTEEQIAAGETPREIPSVVTQAHEVAVGLQPAPDAVKKATVRVRPAILEPTDEDLRDERGTKVYRRKD